MQPVSRYLALTVAMTVAMTVALATPAMAKRPVAASTNYPQVVRDAAGMVGDSKAQRLAAARGLAISSVTWEDTGRYKGSAVGPNISDMTIQVATPADGAGRMDITTMPVIRYPNFADKSADLSPDDFTLLVGNHAGRGLQRVSLTEFLAEPTRFLSKPGSWKAKGKTLLAERDSKVLVSAQAAFLPVPKEGKATFNPVLFNYQSYKDNPAVLTILATREGTSVTIIDNQRDAFQSGFAWGQRLFHNADGMRASLTGERQSDHERQGKPTDGETPQAAGERAGMNMVLLIQVPLKQKTREFGSGLGAADGVLYEAAPPSAMPKKSDRRSDVENAVIGHGDLEGPFTEIDGLKIERDDRFPVRVTIQFYKATSNGVVSAADLDSIKEQIDRVYAHSDYVGSLVTAGDTGRVTEYSGSKVQPHGWWEEFWQRYERDTGIARSEARDRLQGLLGRAYFQKPVTGLYLRDLLRQSL